MITIDDNDPTPPFEQIRLQIADQVRAGTIAGGTRLPAVRQLAADLRVAAGTVAKAYSALEAEALVHSSRSGGTRVVMGRAVPAEARSAARHFVRSLGAVPLTLADALSAVRAEWDAAR